MLSVVSIRHIPAANRIGNTRIIQNESPLEPSAAEIPSTPISVAVSNPRPTRMPSWVHVPATANHAEHRTEKPRKQPTIPEQNVKILVGIRLATADAEKRAVKRAQDDDVHDGDGKQKECRYE